MRVVSHPEAEAELGAAVWWYEERQPGLGGDFHPKRFGSSRTIRSPEFGTLAPQFSRSSAKRLLQRALNLVLEVMAARKLD